MTDIDLQLDLDPASADLEKLTRGLQEHAQAIVPEPGFRPVAVFARDQDNAVVGGVYGRINWDWLSISLLWVHPEQRGSGLGSSLLQRLESEAITMGCKGSHVDTLSYQAREFYEAQGYEAFAELPDYPPPHSRIYFRKSLT